MAWQTIRVANPGYGRRRRVSRSTRNPNILTDLLAGDIASKVSKSVMDSLTGKTRKRKKTMKRRRKNPHLALIGGNPRRKRSFFTSEGKPRSHSRGPGSRKRDVYSDLMSGGYSTAEKKSIKRHLRKRKKKSSSGLKLNAGGTMAKARRRKRNSLRNRARDSKGRLLKVRNKRKRTSSRRRNVARANPRRRRRNKVRVITKIKYRTRRVNVAKRRKRKATRRRSRRRNTVAAVNPRRRRRRSRRNLAAVNPKRRRRARVTRRRRRRNLGRRNAGIGGFLGRLNLMQVAEVGLGTIAGDKIATWGGAKIASMVGVVDPMMTGLIKAGVGVAAAGFVSKYRPALALGLAVGAVNGLINEYIFMPYINPYLPLSGFRGMGEYVDRTWKADNWLAAGGAPGALAGMGNNSLNRSSL